MTFCGNPQYVTDDVDRAQLTVHSLRQKCFAIMCTSQTVTSPINHANPFFPLPMLCREEMAHTVIRV